MPGVRFVRVRVSQPVRSTRLSAIVSQAMSFLGWERREFCIGFEIKPVS